MWNTGEPKNGTNLYNSTNSNFFKVFECEAFLRRINLETLFKLCFEGASNPYNNP